MSKKKHSCPFQAGTFLKKELLLSDAFISLGVNSKTILLMILLKCQKAGNFKSRKNIDKDAILNNGELELSYPELYAYGLTNKSITRAFTELHEKRFIETTYIGGRGKGDYNQYKVVNGWIDYGKSHFVVGEKSKTIKHGFCSKDFDRAGIPKYTVKMTLKEQNSIFEEPQENKDLKN